MCVQKFIHLFENFRNLVLNCPKFIIFVEISVRKLNARPSEILEINVIGKGNCDCLLQRTKKNPHTLCLTSPCTCQFHSFHLFLTSAQPLVHEHILLRVGFIQHSLHVSSLCWPLFVAIFLAHENGYNKGKPRDDTCKECRMKQTI